ncbi:MAG: hypothetical protein AAGG00_01160 [Cyanobacteria bacterium P01_H01_bin.150]
MKKQILSVVIAIPTMIFATSSKLTNSDIKSGVRKIRNVKYHAIKLENSMDAMVNPEKGGVRPMPPPPPWIPPVEEGVNHKLPPAHIPKRPGYGNYTPMRYLPYSSPKRNPFIKDKLQLRNKPAYPIR